MTSPEGSHPPDESRAVDNSGRVSSATERRNWTEEDYRKLSHKQNPMIGMSGSGQMGRSEKNPNIGKK